MPRHTPERRSPSILTINVGSSSIRFRVFAAERTPFPTSLLKGMVADIGTKKPTLSATDADGAVQSPPRLHAGDHKALIPSLLHWLESQSAYASVTAVGHRVVCGSAHNEPELISAALLTELRRLARYDPDHLPRQLALIDALSRRRPALPQVACFDSAFHRTMPRVARLLPIPRRFTESGVERFGFHGLSYSYLMEELGRLDPVAARGRVILAHLGSGASLAAVYRGRSVDTTMGFTPTSGVMMSTRPGDLDPGLVYYLARAEGMTVPRFQRMVAHESGLLGVSGTSSDLRELLAHEESDSNAADAVALFCYQIRKAIGSLAAVMGGVETLIFAGGIGEKASEIRRRVCAGLDFLGIALDRRLNSRSAPLISPASAEVAVRIINTDEDLMIARSVIKALGLGQRQRASGGRKGGDK